MTTPTISQSVLIKEESKGKKHPRASRDRTKEFEEIKKKAAQSNKKGVVKNNPPFFVNETGLYYQPPSQEGEEEQNAIWICSPIWPVAYLRNKEGESHALLIKVHDGERDHLLALPRTIFNQLGKLTELLLDLGQETPVHPANQKHLQTYLQKSRPEKKMLCVDKAGWHDEQYVFPDGQVIGNPAEGEEGIYPLNEVCPKGIGQKGSLEDWQKNVAYLCGNNSRLIFSLGTAFAALCLNLVNAEGGGFNLKGRSSKGKTKCLRVAVSVIGSREYERSWKTTANGLEGTCSLHNDSLLPLDEFGRVDAKDAGDICYMIVGGIGKQRMAKDTSLKDTKTWRVIVLSTGEVGLVDHIRTGNKKAKAGQLARVVDIPAEVEGGHGCFEDLRGHKSGKEMADAVDNACKEYYGSASRTFIERMQRKGLDSVRQELRYGIDDFVADNTKECDGQVMRVAERFGLVYSSLILACNLGVFGEHITLGMIKAAVTKCFKAWLKDRGTKGDAETFSLVEHVKGVLNENAESKFAMKGGDPVDEKRIRNSLWGFREGATFYVFPKAFAENLCNEIGSTDAAKILFEAGLLEKDNEGKYSINRRITAHFKKNDRFYVINLDAEKVANEND